MKKRPTLLCILSLLFLLTNLLPAAHASTIYSELRELYAAGDYPAIAKLLEKRIDEIESATVAGSTKAEDKDRYKLHIMLAHVCAWQLGRFNDGLSEYEKALELRREQEKEALKKSVRTYKARRSNIYLWPGCTNTSRITQGPWNTIKKSCRRHKRTAML